MAKRPRGIRQRVRTSKATYTEQRLKDGRTVYRKGGRFTSKKSYRAARSYKQARVEFSELGRARDSPEQRRRPSTQWVIEDSSTEFGRAGAFASTVIPGLEQGDPLTREERSDLFADMRLIHGFETFWHFRFPDLSRDEAEARFMEMMDRLRKLKTRTERDDVREEFGLDRYETV